MKSVLICFIGLHIAILVNSVSGWKCDEYSVRHEVMNAPFYFGYLGSTELKILMQLKNVSPKITAVKVAVETDDPASKNKFEWDRDGGVYFKLCGELPYSKVTVSLELYSSNGLCATREVSEGRHAMILENGVADPIYKSGHLCLSFRSTMCAIEIDLRNDCIESERDINAKREKSIIPKPTHHYSDTTRNTSNTPKPTIFASPNATQNISHKTWDQSTISNIPKATQTTSHTNTSITPFGISNTRNATNNVSDTSKHIRNISNTSNATWYTSDTPTTIQNISNTPNATALGRNDAVIKKYTIAIASAIFGIALILLGIIKIGKRYWINRNPPGTPELLSNDQSSPFYLNLLFRRECDREIELMEQHHYEEINP